MKDAVTVCRQIYRETADFYRQVQPRLGGNDCGYKILYGPPVIRPPLFIIGYQPGGKDNDEGQLGNDLWPEKCEYAEPAPYLLAKRIFDVLGADLLQSSTGANTLFFRAPSMRRYRQIDPALLRDIEAFCEGKLAEIIGVLRPQRLLFIGLKSSEKWLIARPPFKSDAKRTLGYLGQACDIPALSVLHLTGARIASADRAQINQAIIQFASK